MTTQYVVRKSLVGKHKVHYRCPSCASELESELSEAGKRDNCPNCSAEFVVPGTLERDVETERRKHEERQKVERRVQAEKELDRAKAAAALHNQEAARGSEERRRNTPVTQGLEFSGLLLGAAAIVIGFIFLAYDTSREGVHNIGLLNDRVVGSAWAMTFFLGAIILRGVGKIGREINRWGGGRE
jgi:hypothetical protein